MLTVQVLTHSYNHHHFSYVYTCLSELVVSGRASTCNTNPAHFSWLPWESCLYVLCCFVFIECLSLKQLYPPFLPPSFHSPFLSAHGHGGGHQEPQGAAARCLLGPGAALLPRPSAQYLAGGSCAYVHALPTVCQSLLHLPQALWNTVQPITR